MKNAIKGLLVVMAVAAAGFAYAGAKARTVESPSPRVEEVVFEPEVIEAPAPTQVVFDRPEVIVGRR